MSLSQEIEKLAKEFKKENELELEQGGQRFFATSYLAKEFGYDQDHIGLLIRQGKIKGIRSGKKWFALPESLQEYKNRVEEQKKINALKSITIPRRPLAPSTALSQTADKVESGRVNLSTSIRSVFKFALPGFFVLLVFSSIAAFANNDELKNNLKNLGKTISKLGGEFVEIITPPVKLAYEDKEIVFRLGNEKFLNFKNLQNEFDLTLYDFQTLSQNYSANILDQYVHPILSPFTNILGRLFGSKTTRPELVEGFENQVKELEKQLNEARLEILGNKKLIEENLKQTTLTKEKEVITQIGEERRIVTERRIITIPSNIETRILAVEQYLEEGKEKFNNIELALSSVNNRFSYTPTILIPVSGGNTARQGVTVSNPATTESETVRVSNLLDVSGDAQISRSFNVDSGTFYVDPTNNRVGINTTSPEVAFELVGAASISGGLSVGSLSVGGSGNSLLDVGPLHVTSSGVGIGTTSPSTKLEVQGTASSSYGLFGTLQIGGFSSTSYNRFGTSTTSHSNYISASNDILVSGDLEVRGTASFAGVASVSGNLYVFGNIGIGTTNVPNQLTVIGSGSFSGQLKATRNPTLAHTGTWPSFSNTNDSTFLVNPSSPVADGNIIAYVSGSDPKFVVDAEGDVYVAGNLILSGTTTQSTTSVTGDLNVEGNARLGDAQTDVIKLSGTIRPRTLTSFPVLVKASASQTVDVFRILDTSDNILFTLDQGTGLLTASSGFNFALGGSTATVSYSRLGTSTTGHSSDIDKFNDLLISGGLEIDGNTFLDSKASISSNLQISGRFIADTAASHSFTGDLTVSKEFISSGGTSNSFAGSLLVSKGFNAQAIVGTALTINGNANITGTTTLSNLLSFSGTDHAGLKLNNLTTAQRDLLSAGSGMNIFNTTVSKMQVYNGTSWKNVGNPEIGAEVTSGTAGSVLFVDGSGNLGQNNNNFYWDVTNARLGLGTSSPTTKLEIQGTASASFGLFGTLQIGGFSSVSYSRFGTATTGHANYISTTNDVLVSGDLEVRGTSSFGGAASVSGNFFTYGTNTFSGTGSSSFAGSLSVTKGLRITGNITNDVLTASRLVSTNAGKVLSSVSTLTDWIAGTTNQITVSDDGDGTITLSAPQNIHTSATPQFAKLGLGTAPTTVFEAQGTASASFGLFGTLQIGGFSSVSYSRFGTATTGHANYISTTNDVLVSGDLEVRGTSSFGGAASVSGNFFTYGTNTFSGTGSSSFLGSLDITKGIRAAQADFDNILVTTSGGGITFNGGGTNTIQSSGGGTLTINAFTLGGTITGNNQQINNLNKLGIGTIPVTLLEVQGTASASYLLTGNTLQVGGYSSAAYSRFGTATATDSTVDTTNDLLISGSLEVDSVFRVDGTGSHTLAGEWNFDSNTLGIDSGTNRVGIATSPTSLDTTLEVGGTASISGATTLRGITYTWPSADGSSGQQLQTNGSGTLSWAAAGVPTSNSLDFDEFVQLMTIDQDTTITASSSLTFNLTTTDDLIFQDNGTTRFIFDDLGRVGINTATPQTLFEVQGTASASYLLTGNTLQVGGFASVAYNRFGTATTTHAGTISDNDDLLISGGLEVNGSVAFDGFAQFGTNASISGNLELTGKLISTGPMQTYTATLADVINTTTETTFLSFTLPANALASGDIIRAVVTVLVKNNQAGDNTTTFKGQIDSGTSVTVANTAQWSNNANERAAMLEFVWQRVGTALYQFYSPSGSNKSLTGNMGADLTIVDNAVSIGTPDFTGARVIKINMKFNTADATLYIKPQSALVYKVINTTDLAENYPTDEKLESGDVVAFDPAGNKKIKKASISDLALAGIVSTTPGITLGEGLGGSLTGQGLIIGEKKDNEVPLALSGRVPVKISDENGLVKVGDRLTISKTIPGYAMKMIEAGQSVGIALEPFETVVSGSYDKILAFVNLSYWAPSFAEATEGTASSSLIDQLLSGVSSSSYDSGGTIFDIKILFASILDQFLKVGIIFEKNLIKVAEIITDKLMAKEVETDKLCVGQTCVTEQELKTLLEKNGIEASQNSPPSSETSADTAEPTPSSTPEPIPESTPEPDSTTSTSSEQTILPQVTPEPTPAPSESPTPESSPESTPEPTPEVTPEPSPTPTE